MPPMAVAGHPLRVYPRLSLLPVVLVGALVVALAGCSSTSGHQTSPRSVAARFDEAVSAKDFSGACALLTPATRTDLADDAGGSCSAALRRSGVKQAGAAIETKTYGRAALVTTATTATFLARSGTTWAIRAAGCTPVVDGPFDCTVGGD